MNTNQVGNLGELKVIEKCLRNNIQVFTPFGDGNTADMILIVNGKCIKVQVKSSTTNNDGTVTFKTCSTQSNRSEQPKHFYTEDEIDAFLFYSYAFDEIYCMPVKEVLNKVSVNLRHTPPKTNNQKCKMVSDYPFEKIFQINDTK